MVPHYSLKKYKTQPKVVSTNWDRIFIKIIEQCRMETIQDFLLMEYNIYNNRIRIFHLSNFMTKLVI